MWGRWSSCGIASSHTTETGMAQQFVFDCPACDVQTTVDEDIRAELLDDGCVLCGEAVETDDFTRRSVSRER